MKDLIEKKIEVTFRKIKRKELTPKESGIGKLLNKLKEIDTISYNERMGEYKEILTQII